MIAYLTVSVICGLIASAFSLVALDGGVWMGLVFYVLGQWVGFGGATAAALYRRRARATTMPVAHRKAAF